MTERARDKMIFLLFKGEQNEERESGARQEDSSNVFLLSYMILYIIVVYL